ncbi:MAG: vitamin K epoxide reductase family protein [bacterium]
MQARHETWASPRRTVARVALTAVLLAGTAIGLYLTAHHDSQLYGDKSFTLENCPQSETVDCEAVNTSAWSEIAGIPIAALAPPFYVLVLGLVWAGRREPQYHAHAFVLGLVASALSVALFFISKFEIGFLCLWCMRLYAVSLAIPVLVALLAEQGPRMLVSQTLASLLAWPYPLRMTALAWVVLLGTATGTERVYRNHVHEAARIRAHAAPSAPVTLASAAAVPTPATTTHADATAPGVFRLPAAPRRVIAEPGHFRAETLDLEARLGQGTPIALVFWAPGFAWSERALVAFTTTMRQRWPRIEVYAVAGKRAEKREEELYETFGLLPVPADVPLLIDDDFALAKAVRAEDVPSLVLFDGQGRFVVSGVKDLGQRLASATGPLTAAELVARVAAGDDVPTLANKYPYFPGMDLDRSCAPGFQLPRFGTSDAFTFEPRRGRPTMLVFWSATCKHCQQELPQLVRWLAAHPGAIDVISVTRVPADKPGEPSRRAVTTEYVQRTGISFPVLDDWGGAVNERYAVVSTPTSIFVSPDGAIVEEWFYPHPDGFDAAMERAVARASAPTPCAPPPPQPSARLDFRVADVSGGEHAVADLAAGPSIVHLWATWCQPCLAELPALLAFRQRLEATSQARVIFVSVEPTAMAPTIGAFTQRVGFGFHSFLAPHGGIADRIELSYHVPRSYLVAPGGRLLEILHGAQPWSDPLFQERIRSRFRNAAPE